MNTNSITPNDDDNHEDEISIPVPVEQADTFEMRMKELGLTAWIERQGVTGIVVFTFSDEDDPEKIQMLRDEFKV